MKGRITCATSSSLLNEEREPCFVSAQDMPVLSEKPNHEEIVVAG